VLRLTPKSPVMVKSLDRRDRSGARTDPQGDVDARRTAAWINLVQTYAPVAGHAYVAKQVATINLPRMKADSKPTTPTSPPSKRRSARRPDTRTRVRRDRGPY